jgi:hypothetical protein
MKTESQGKLDVRRESRNHLRLEEQMADELQACCQRARKEFIERVTKTLASYPLIKNLPCPQCRRVIPIRIYEPPDQAAAR